MHRNGLEDGIHYISFRICQWIHEWMRWFCNINGWHFTHYIAHIAQNHRTPFSPNAKTELTKTCNESTPLSIIDIIVALQLRSHSLKYEMAHKWRNSSTMHIFPWRSLWVLHHTSLQCSIYNHIQLCFTHNFNPMLIPTFLTIDFQSSLHLTINKSIISNTIVGKYKA
mgnify:CR=1 FL=1